MEPWDQVVLIMLVQTDIDVMVRPHLQDLLQTGIIMVQLLTRTEPQILHVRAQAVLHIHPPDLRAHIPSHLGVTPEVHITEAAVTEAVEAPEAAEEAGDNNYNLLKYGKT